MDTARLPAYRSSYLLRFHPYPRVKPSTRERIMASTQEDGSYQPLQMNALLQESEIPSALNQVIHGSDVLCSQRLTVSSLVVELAFLFVKKTSPQDT